MSTENKPLCYAPFIGMFASSYNTYAPCCVSTRSKAAAPGDYWVSDEIKNIRTKLLNQQWPDQCNYCKIKKDNNLKNDSIFWDYHYSTTDNIDIDVDNGNSTKGPLFLDYRPSNMCNLKCRMCTPFASSKIEDEVLKNPILQKWLPTPAKKPNNFEEFMKYTQGLSLQQIKILGGEPTIDPLTISFLENIIDNYSQLPELRFTTNGTNLNHRFRAIMEKFDKIHVMFSIDGTGNTYEYIRTNASWSKTKRNIERVFKDNLATMYGFSSVLMPYNIFNITDLLDWYYELYQNGYNFFVFFNSSSDIYTGLQAVLPEDLSHAIESVKTWFLDKDEDFIKNVSGISQLIPLMSVIEFNQAAHDEFKEYNNTLDKIRKTGLQSMDVRFCKYI